MNNTDKQPQTDKKCIAGCKEYYGGEKKHHKDCPFYPDSLSEYYDKRYCFTPEELEVLKAKWEKEQWISVKDRLPKDYQTVLWFDKRDEKINLGYFVFSQTKNDHVAYWMPLPQPPKQ